VVVSVTQEGPTTIPASNAKNTTKATRKLAAGSGSSRRCQSHATIQLRPLVLISLSWSLEFDSVSTFVYAIAISNPSGEITLPNLVLLGPKATSLRPSLMPSHLGLTWCVDWPVYIVFMASAASVTLHCHSGLT